MHFDIKVFNTECSFPEAGNSFTVILFINSTCPIDYFKPDELWWFIILKLEKIVNYKSKILLDRVQYKFFLVI